MIKRIVLWGLLVGLVTLCVVWFGGLTWMVVHEQSMRSGVAKLRAEHLRKSTGPIVIGIAESKDLLVNKDFVAGVELAVEEINASGKVLSRDLKLIFKDDGLNRKQAISVAQEFVENLDVVAVVGHYWSDQARETAIVYEFNGLLFVSPGASDPHLTENGYDLVFCTTPNDDDVGRQLARLAKEKNFRNVLVYYSDNDFGRSLANSFEIQAGNLNISVVDRKKHHVNVNDWKLSKDLQYWDQFFQADAILLATPLLDGAKMIKLASSLKRKPVFLGTDALDNPELFRLAGQTDNLYIVSDYASMKKNPINARFRQAFFKKYKRKPTGPAAKGYDTIHAIAIAIRQAQSIVPADIARAMRNMKEIEGTMGPERFRPDGSIVATLVEKKAEGRKFVVNKIIANGPQEKVK